MRYPRSAIETSHDATAVPVARWRCVPPRAPAPGAPGAGRWGMGRADRWEMRGDWGLASRLRLRPPVRPPDPLSVASPSRSRLSRLTADSLRRDTVSVSVTLKRKSKTCYA